MQEGWEALDAEACKALSFHSPQAVLFTDPRTGRILAANPAACRLLGYDEGDLRRIGRDGIVDPDDRDRWEAALAERARTGLFEADLSFRCRDGSTLEAEVTSVLFTDAAGQERNCLIVRDVTARRAEDAALRASEQLFRRLIATSTEAFVAMNTEGRITEWNQQAEVTFGWPRHEAIGRRLVDTIIPPRYREDHSRGLAHYLLTGEGPVLGQRLELEGRRRDGREFPVELTIWALDSGGDLMFNALLHDISERRRAEEELWELALVDDLTGLHNRRAFTLLAEQAVKEVTRAGRPLIGLFVDVDGLKAINDTYGHPAGDQVLRLVAGALRAACRESDIVGRLGGDEFAILLAEADQVDGIEARLAAQVARAAATVTYPVSVSIGLAVCQPDPDHDCDLDELIQRADQAMYAHKARKSDSRSDA
ncbi:MAG: diguanylate cyclase [Actinomycetota bacterium]|jgi:diguanylate cyclase